MDPDRSRRVTIKRARFGEEDERLDREFWARMSSEERVLETWRLSLELWELKGWDSGEPGLRRFFARVALG